MKTISNCTWNDEILSGAGSVYYENAIVKCILCSVILAHVASFTFYKQILQIAFSPLPNGARSRAPTLFSTYPSETNFVAAFGAFISQYGWRRLLVITQRESFFTTVSSSTLVGCNASRN